MTPPQRPAIGIDALIQQLDDMRARLLTLENDPHRTGSGGATVPMTGAQFNPQLIGQMIGTVPGRVVPIGSGLTGAFFDPQAVSWTSTSSDYDVTHFGNRVQLPWDALWLFVIRAIPIYSVLGAIPETIAVAYVQDGGNLTGHVSPSPLAIVATFDAGATQIMGYGNSIALGMACISFDASAIDGIPVVSPDHFKITMDIHRLIEG